MTAKVRKARIRTVRRGEYEYFEPQIRRRFLGLHLWWVSVSAYRCDGSIYRGLGHRTRCDLREDAVRHLRTYAKLTGEALEVIGG